MLTLFGARISRLCFTNKTDHTVLQGKCIYCRWFNSKSNFNLLTSLKESLFGFSENSPSKSRLAAKLKHSLLFIRFNIYFCKLHNKALTLSDFTHQTRIKYELEKYRSLSYNQAIVKSVVLLLCCKIHFYRL